MRGALAVVVVASLACPSTEMMKPDVLSPVELVSDQTAPLALELGTPATWVVHVRAKGGGAPPKYKMDGAPEFLEDLGQTRWSVTNTGSGTETITIEPRDYQPGVTEVSINACPDKPFPVRDKECATFRLPTFVHGGPADRVTPLVSSASVLVAEKRHLEAFVSAPLKKSRSWADRIERSSVPATWSSADTSIATVSSDGLVEGKAPGSTTLSVSAGGKSATVAVTVVSGTPAPPADFDGQPLDLVKTWDTGPVAAFDDRGYPFILGRYRHQKLVTQTPVSGEFSTLFLAEWTGSGWGVTFLTTPSQFVHEGTMLVDRRNRVMVFWRGLFGVELAERDASDVGGAWRRRKIDRLTGLHPELDATILQEAFDLSQLEGNLPLQFAALERPDGGLFAAVPTYETNERFPFPFQCVENVRVFEVTDSELTSVDAVSQRHDISRGTGMAIGCGGPVAPSGSLSMLPRLGGDRWPRLLYGAANDLGPFNTLFPTVDGEHYGSAAGMQLFTPASGRWRRRDLVPDGGIDIGQGRTATVIKSAAFVTASDPRGVLISVPDSFRGGDYELPQTLVLEADGGLTPQPWDKPADWMDPFINLGRVEAGTVSRLGRTIVATQNGFALTMLERRQPLFTDAMTSPSGQRLGAAFKTDALVTGPHFDAMGRVFLFGTHLQLGESVFTAAPASPTLSIANRNTLVLAPVVMSFGQSLFLYTGNEVHRSDDQGATFQMVRAVSDSFRPTQVAFAPGGAMFALNITSGTWERRFSSNLPGGAPITTVPLPATTGLLVLSQSTELDAVVRLVGNEFIVLSRLAVQVSGQLERHLFVERFDLTGAPVGTRDLNLQLPSNPALTLALNGGVFLSTNSFAFVSWTTPDTRVVVLDLTTGAPTRITTIPVARTDNDARFISATGQLLRTSDGKLLLASVEKEPVVGSMPLLYRFHPMYRVSTDDGATFGSPRALAPAVAQASIPAWGLNPVNGALVVVLRDTFTNDHFGENVTHADAPFVSYVRSVVVP